MFGVKQLIKGSCEAALFSCLKIGCNSDNLVTFGDEKLK